MPTRVPGFDPQTEHTRALKDVWVLLDFLGRQADSRLQAQFEDTRIGLATPSCKLAAPPCRTYRHFLKRVMSISDTLSGSDPAAPAQSPTAGSPPEGDEGMEDLDFLYFTRDFLAAVAAPATVHTIGVTRAYINARRLSRHCFERCRLPRCMSDRSNGGNRQSGITSTRRRVRRSSGWTTGGSSPIPRPAINAGVRPVKSFMAG